jgi:hypothetical protein
MRRTSKAKQEPSAHGALHAIFTALQAGRTPSLFD